MALQLDDIQRLAYLARIQINEHEAEATLAKLSGILGLIEHMQKIDTTGIAPMSHAQEVTQRLRDDIVTQSNQRTAFQAIAPLLNNGVKTPAVADGLYLVPKVIE